jgi:hypothetical protein
MEILNIFNEFASAYMYLCWFISMALLGIFTPFLPSAIFVPIILSVSTLRIRNRSVQLLTRIMPLFWVAIGLYGGFFHRRQNEKPWPNSVYDFILICLVIFIIYGIYCIFKNYRFFTILIFILNLYFVLFVSFVAAMAISGDWL